MLWDPVLVICLLGQVLVGNSWSITSNNAELLLNWDGLLGASKGAASTLTTLASLAGLWEESLDPGLVNVVHGSSSGGSEDQIEEEALVG